jgi:hypothetical protein
MGWECGTHGRNVFPAFWLNKLKERDCLVYKGVYGRMVLKWKKFSMKVMEHNENDT